MGVGYKCSGCNEDCERSLLSVKKVMFTAMGAGAQTLRSRVVGHFCPRCVAQDPDYNREPYGTTAAAQRAANG